jgi:hypothetical protein
MNITMKTRLIQECKDDTARLAPQRIKTRVVIFLKWRLMVHWLGKKDY